MLLKFPVNFTLHLQIKFNLFVPTSEFFGLTATRCLKLCCFRVSSLCSPRFTSFCVRTLVFTSLTSGQQSLSRRRNGEEEGKAPTALGLDQF